MLTGTFFGFNLYGNDIPFFNKMRDLFFLDNQWMFNLSLILGAVQIIFGMVLKAANQTIQFGFKYALFYCRMDYSIGQYGIGVPFGRCDADGRNSSFGNTGYCRSAYLPV